MFGNNLKNLLNSISDQFGVSTGGIIGFVIGLFAIIMFIVLSSLIQAVLVKKRRRRFSRQIFTTRAKKKNLSESQRELLHKLAVFLPDPELAYLLFKDAAKFGYCARKLLESGDTAEKDIAALRVTLGFSGETPESLPVSTASLNPGLHITCRKGGRYLAGKITAQEKSGFWVLVRQAVLLRPDDSVIAYFTMPRGRFQFSTKVLNAEGSKVLLEHSEQIKLSQNRNYYRGEYNGTIQVRNIGGAMDVQQYPCNDLGGGGLSFISGNTEFMEGDLLSCKLPDFGNFTLRVVRTSRRGKIVHGEFEEIDEQIRDRIFHALFQSGK